MKAATAPFLRAVRRVPPVETAVLIAALAILVALAATAHRANDAAPAFDSYSTYDAGSGGYAALYELLAREGVPVERFERRPAFLEPDLDTLVWAEPLPFDTRRLAPAAADVRALEAYVRAGGRLLYIGHDDAAAEAHLLALPGSRRAGRERRSLFVAAPLAAAGVRALGVSAARRYVTARRDERVLFNDGRGAVVITYPFGRGRVTALIDETLFTGARLASGDAARLAVALARPGRGGGRVAFDEAVHGYAVVEHWWQIVPRSFAVALSVAAFALLVAFTGAAIRLGPPLLAQEHDERTTAEFVIALASLLERGRAARFALESATRSTARALSRALGLGANATEADIAAALHDPVARAAFGELIATGTGARAPRERELVHGIALAQRLRKEYAAYGRSRY